MGGGTNVFLGDSFDDYSIVQRAGCYVINILSPPPTFPPVTIWDFPSFCQSSWRHVDFSTRFFWAWPKATQTLCSLELQIPLGAGPGRTTAVNPPGSSRARGLTLGGFLTTWLRANSGKVLPALFSRLTISIHFDVQKQ